MAGEVATGILTAWGYLVVFMVVGSVIAGAIMEASAARRRWRYRVPPPPPTPQAIAMSKRIDEMWENHKRRYAEEEARFERGRQHRKKHGLPETEADRQERQRLKEWKKIIAQTDANVSYCNRPNWRK